MYNVVVPEGIGVSHSSARRREGWNKGSQGGVAQVEQLSGIREGMEVS